MPKSSGEEGGRVSFQDECALLAPLETFDPAAFRADDQVPQRVCNVVLSLALIFNDCKDAVYAHVLLSEARRASPHRLTRAEGASSGIEFHIVRAIAGLIHELLELIRDNRESIEEAFFVSIVRQLRPNARKAWKALTAVAFGEMPSDSFGKRLLLLRNKVFFHYDPAAIFAGYRHHFLSATKLDDRAFVSRGTSMRESRFYYADAAALGYLNSLVGEEQRQELLHNVGDMIEDLNLALFGIVDGFLQKRGFGYRAEAE